MTPSSPNTIGIGIPRSDGVAKVTGKALYVDDLRPEGCLYGATVRSPHAHARIVSITLDDGYDWTDVTVVTAADIPGENLVALITDDQPALAAEEVRHVTEAVALVAAPTRDRAFEAARHVNVVYEALPAILDPKVAEGNPIRIGAADGPFPDNVFKRIRIRKAPGGAPTGNGAGSGIEGSSTGESRAGGSRIGGSNADEGEDAPAPVPEGAIVVEGTYTLGHQEQLYIEPQGMLAIPESDGSLSIIGSMQCPYYIQKALKRFLGHANFHVVQAATGGGFGGKEEYPSMVAAHCALLAIATGKPVKLIYRRDEDLRATTKRHPMIATLKTVVARDGKLLSWHGSLLVDGGAYNTLTPVVLSRGLLHFTGPYACDDVDLHGVAVATHTVPNGAFRGFGAPQAMFAVERHMDHIARRLGMDPVALRRRNLYKDGDLTATGQVLADVGIAQVLEAALLSAQAPVPEAKVHPGGGRGRYARGRGLSLVFHGCGFTGLGESWIKGKVALELDGSTVRIYTGSTDIGQGTETIFPQIAAAELGIPLERVVMVAHDTALVPDSGPTVASRTTMVVGSVVQSCARKLREALQLETGIRTDNFSALLEARKSPASLRVEHVYAPDASLRWDDQRYVGDAYPTYGWSAGIVDLDVDQDTGEVFYRRFVSATDVGRAINPVLARGQLEGGALQALGWATMEEVVLDKEGGMRNNRLTNYIVPTCADAPEMVTLLVEIPYAGGPFGAKGIGEIPMDGPAAAVAAAIEQATGGVLNHLPMTPERVLEVIS